MGWLTGSKLAEARRLVAQLNDPARAQRAAAELLRLGESSVPALAEALAARDPAIQAAVAELLVRLGPPAMPELVRTLHEAHPLLRAQAARILGRMRDPSAIPVLLDALRSEFYTVRAGAAFALGEIGHSQALPGLLQALKDPEPQVRSAAAQASAKFHSPAVFDEIANLLLDDPEIEVRQAAARALGGTRHPAALPLLMEALGDSFWWYEREGAAAVLLDSIQCMGAMAVDPLVDALSDTEGTVRRYAALILGSLKDKRALQPLGMALYDMHHEVGTAAALALSALGADSLEILDEAARHPEAGIRENIAVALANIDHPRSASILLNLLHDHDRVVVKQAIQSLASLSDPRAAEALSQRAADRSDRELQALARESLGKMKK